MWCRPDDRFTRETLIGLTADIETRLWRHSFNEANNIPHEHPRASTTDDVECFFSVLRDCVEKKLHLKAGKIHSIYTLCILYTVDHASL